MSEDNLIRLTPNQADRPSAEEVTKSSKPKHDSVESNHSKTHKKGHSTSKSKSSQVGNKTGSQNNQVISKIQSQKKKGRYNIFIDNEYAFPVDESILVRYNLTKGMYISKDLQEELKQADHFSKAYSRALNYLSYSLRTEKQVRDDLVDKEFEQEAEAVIAKLKDQLLINDLEYAKSYIRTAANINRKGPRLIYRDLVTKGVSEMLIAEAMDEYPHDLQLENACHLIEKQFNKGKNKSQRQQEQKVKSFLFSKGYDGDVIEIAFSQVEPEVDSEEEYQALVQQGDKAWKRYARKSKGYELHQKVKAFLFNKGFPSDLINHYIDQKIEDVDVEP